MALFTTGHAAAVCFALLCIQGQQASAMFKRTSGITSLRKQQLRAQQVPAVTHFAKMPETRTGSVAIAVSGGLRGAEKCAESLAASLVRPNLALQNKVGVFVATWTDRGCMGGSDGMTKIETPPVTEQEVRKIYSKAGVSLEGVSVKSPVGQGIPETFRKNWWQFTYNDYAMKDNMHMLDGTHHMATLWANVMGLVPDTYDVILRVRPDQLFPPDYSIVFSNHFNVQSSRYEWECNISRKLPVKAGMHIWKSPLEHNTVYMSQNTYHAPVAPDTNKGSIPDDRSAWGLTAPMKGVFATMVDVADSGVYDVSTSEYIKAHGQPELEPAHEIYKTLHPGKTRPLNPQGAWVREQYPEKLLKHHILKQGFSYKLINMTDAYVSPFYAVTLVKGC